MIEWDQVDAQDIDVLSIETSQKTDKKPHISISEMWNLWAKNMQGILAPPQEKNDEVIMKKICKIEKNGGSPLCNNWSLYNTGKAIFEARGFRWDIALGIMYAESHIGANYAWSCDKSWNNRGGIKWRKLDDGTNVRDQKIPNNWNCRLYKFNSVEDYFVSKANTLSLWYGACIEWDDPVICISYSYVWDRNVSETHRVNNVYHIANK